MEGRENVQNDNSAEILEDSLSIDEIIQKNVSKNIRELCSFFNSGEFTTEKGDPRTNIINVAAKKTYCVPEQYLERFFTILDTCRQESLMLHYSERQETDVLQKSGIMIDFDRYQRSKNAQIGEHHFESMTRHLSKLLRETIDFEEFAINRTFTFHIFYIRKPSVVIAPTLPGQQILYKDGFHILIPEIQVIKGYKRFLNEELISRGIMKKVFDDIDHIDSADKMVDKMSASNPVHFFGNSKPEKPSYKLTNAYQVTFYTDDTDIDKKELDVVQILSGLFKPNRDSEPIPINLTYELSLATYFGTFAGKPTWLKKRQCNYCTHLEAKIQILMEKNASGVFTDEELRRDEEDISLTNITNPRAKYIYNLLRILDISYATDYEKWFKVMCAIAHSGISEDYKNVAREFSKRKPDSWSVSEFERVWSEALNGRYDRAPVTIRSIKHWAYTSSPQLYAEVENEHYSNKLRRAAYEHEGRVEQATAADVCHSMCGDKFVSAEDPESKSGKEYRWFEFVTPGQAMKKGEIYKWRREVKPDNIHLFIADHLPKVYNQVRDSIKEHKDNATNEAEAKYWSVVEKNFKLYRTKLGNNGFQNGIVSQAEFRFRQRGFMEELDSYEDVIGVGNGVLKIGAEPQLIRGFHEYKISKYTETDYVPYDPESKYVKKLMTAFADIFPEKDVLRFMLLHGATGLDHKESACILTLLVGGGRNGKTFFAKMMHNTLGNMYCASGKSSLVTAPMEKGGDANSAQMQQKDKNWFYIDEFNKCEVLNTARVKSMVTPCWQSGRDLFTKQANFKNTSNLICLSNFDFIIDETDHGTWRRIYYYRNKVKFCENPNPNNPYEKKVDKRFLDQYTNDPMYKQAMLSILVHYYSILCKEYGGNLANVPVPTIERETELFRNRQDAMNKFITQMIVKSPNSEPIAFSALAHRYVEWYNSNIKPKTHTVFEIQAQFENSRVASSLERQLNDTMFLIGHRIKDSPEEAPREGEEYICEVNHQPQIIDDEQQSSEINESVVSLCREKERMQENYITAIEKNTPIHTQQRETPATNFTDAIDDNILDILTGII